MDLNSRRVKESCYYQKYGKGNKEREVYFNTRCAIWLKRYLDERDDEETCLFIMEQNL